MPFLPLILSLALRPPAHHTGNRVDLGGGIKVTFPSKPLAIQDSPTSIAGMWSALDGKTSYQVEVEEITNKRLASAGILAHRVSVESALIEATSVHQTPILLHGWKGAAVELSRPGWRTICRIYCLKDRTITLSFSPAPAKPPSAAASFFESLTFPKTLIGPFHSPTEPEKAPAAEFFPVDLADGVKAVFPAEPEPVKAMNNGMSKIWDCQTDLGGCAIEVDSPTFLPLTAEGILKAGVKNTAGSMKGTILSESPLLLNGWKGLEFKVRGESANAWGRLYAIHGKVFELIFASAPNALPAEAAAFLRSLSVPGNLAGPFHTATEPEKANVQVGSGPTDLGGGFLVQFPSPPTRTDVPTPKAITVWMSTSDAGTFDADITVGVEPAADDGAKSLIEGMVGTLSSAHAPLSSQKDVIIDGWPGLEFQGRSDILKVWGRVYRVDKTMVFMMAGIPVSRDFSPGVRAFLDSLKLPAGTPPGPHATAGPTFKEYEMPDLGVKAIFPTEPRKKQEILNSKAPDYPATFYASEYGDRAFNVVGGDMPPTASATATQSEIDQFLGGDADTIAKTLNMTILRQQAATVKGKRVLTCELRGAGSAARMVASYYGGHYLFVIAIAPKAIFPSEEVEKFFASVQPIK